MKEGVKRRGGNGDCGGVVHLVMVVMHVTISSVADVSEPLCACMRFCAAACVRAPVCVRLPWFPCLCERLLRFRVFAYACIVCLRLRAVACVRVCRTFACVCVRARALAGV